jgi:hypothetical protein
MKNKTSILLTALGLVALIVFLGWLVIRSNRVKYGQNPWEYDLKGLSKNDSIKPTYKEIDKIRLGLKKASGIAISSNDKIFITGDSSLLIFNTLGQKLDKIYLGKFGRSLAVANNQLFIGVENHIDVYSTEGKFIIKWKAPTDSSVITSVAVRKNDVFVADAQCNQVYRYDLNGNKLQTFGNNDTTEQVKRFIIPSYNFDLAIDPDGGLWVVNPGKHLLVNFNERGDVFTFWGKTTTDMDGFCGCCNPIHISILPDGSFVTSEKGIVRVKKFSHSGKFVALVAGPESFMEESLSLDLAIDSKQRIWVLEPMAGVVHVFEETKLK